MNSNEELSAFFADLAVVPRFTKRPTNIPGDFRTPWRLAVLCLILDRGRAKTLSLEHLHVLWWAVRSANTRELFLRWFRGQRRPDELLVRFDPSLTVTLDLALGQRLVDRTATNGVHLTPAGHELAEIVRKDKSALIAEREFLDALPSSINQKQLRALLEWK